MPVFPSRRAAAQGPARPQFPTNLQCRVAPRRPALTLALALALALEQDSLPSKTLSPPRSHWPRRPLRQHLHPLMPVRSPAQRWGWTGRSRPRRARWAPECRRPRAFRGPKCPFLPGAGSQARAAAECRAPAMNCRSGPNSAACWPRFCAPAYRPHRSMPPRNPGFPCAGSLMRPQSAHRAGRPRLRTVLEEPAVLHSYRRKLQATCQAPLCPISDICRTRQSSVVPHRQDARGPAGHDLRRGRS